MPRFVICDFPGYAFATELSRALATCGHQVLHLCADGVPAPTGHLAQQPCDPSGFRIARVSAGLTLEKERLFRRRRIEAKLGRLMAEQAIGFRPDVVVGGNMPIDAAVKLWRACRQERLPYISWVQDLYSPAIIEYLGGRYGIVGRAAGRHYARIEASLLRTSDAVIAISEAFLPQLASWRVPRDRIHLVPNWAPLSELPPRGKDNPWARRHQLEDRFVAMYTGTLGLRHDPSLLCDLALAGRAHGVEVVVTAAGAKAEWLKRQRDAHALDNLAVLPFQPMTSYPDLLGTADVLLALLSEEASRFSVPSKVLSYLAAGRPIVAAIAEGNDAARTILAAQAGYVTAPSDRTGFIERVLTLARDPQLAARFGRAGRSYAEQHFAIERIAGRFLDLLLPLVRTASL